MLSRIFLITLFLIVCSIVLFAQYREIGYLTFLLDDVWIHLTFARNWAEGFGFSFNPGEPIASSTAPLYTALLSLGFIVSPWWKLSIYIINISSGIGIIFCLYAILGYVLSNRVTRYGILFFFVIHPWFIWSTLSGMETNVAMLLLLGGVLCALNISKNTKNIILMNVCFALLSQVRPEMYVILLISLLFTLFHFVILYYSRYTDRKYLFFILSSSLISVAGVVIPYALFARSTTGSLFPNTYSAKIGGSTIFSDLGIYVSFEKLLEGLMTYVSFFAANADTLVPGGAVVLSVLVVLALVISLYEKDWWISGLAAGFIAWFFAVAFITGSGVSWPWLRHMIPWLPLILVIVFYSIERVSAYFLRKLNAVNQRESQYFIGISFAIYVLLYVPFGIAIYFFMHDTARAFDNYFTTLVTYIDEKIPKNAIIASSDVGIISFYTDHYIVDTEGLMVADVGSYYQDRDKTRQEVSQDIILKHQPDYINANTKNYLSSFFSDEYPILVEAHGRVLRSTPWTDAFPVRD